MDELNDNRDPSTRAAADQLHADALDALRASRAFMLVTVDEHGTPHLRCTITDPLTVTETARFAAGVRQAAGKVIARLNESIELTMQMLDDEEAA